MLDLKILTIIALFNAIFFIVITLVLANLKNWASKRDLYYQKIIKENRNEHFVDYLKENKELLNDIKNLIKNR